VPVPAAAAALAATASFSALVLNEDIVEYGVGDDNFSDDQDSESGKRIWRSTAGRPRPRITWQTVDTFDQSINSDREIQTF
jgi:hypothetical protein